MEPDTWSAGPRRRIALILVIVVIGLVGVAAVAAIADRVGGDTKSADNDDVAAAVTTVPRGGELRVGARQGAQKTVDCNDGNLILYGTGIFSVIGRCLSITTGATLSQVSIEQADVVNVTGYDSEYFITGHSASLTVTKNGNKVHIDSVDAINFSGDDNTVDYRSGSPEVADAGVGNDSAERK